MNRLLKTALKKGAQQQNQVRSLMSSPAMCAGFAKDFTPGPYPKTEAERVAAAKKYNMKPEDYKPFPDDGTGYGDYPDLPKISVDMKSTWEEYDDMGMRRNFGEPVIVTQEQVLQEKITHRRLLYTHPTIIAYFFLGFTTVIGLNYLLWDYKCTIPIAPKQYPRDVELYGESHYKI
jgi:NADH dehydrogenase (ubiquinone) 1 beta subcomplex subunit 8